MQRQLDDLSELKPDICFLQEVNPLQERTKKFRKVTGLKSSVQPDLYGLKLLGFGPPFNLQNGLSILFPSTAKLIASKGFRLSGRPFSYASEAISLQLGESRHGFYVDVELESGHRLLLVTLHLHHGVEFTAEFQQRLSEIFEETQDVDLSAKNQFYLDMQAADLRREQELLRLMDKLPEDLDVYDEVLIGGDFNMTPESIPYARFERLGFTDCWKRATTAPGLSWNLSANGEVLQLNKQFQQPFNLAKYRFSAPLQSQLEDALSENEDRARRIDYIWQMKPKSGLKPKSVFLFGQPKPDQPAGSDHFGVCIDFKWPKA